MLGGFLEEGVGRFFTGDGGGGAMARINSGFSGKSEDFFSDAGQKKVTVAAGQIPTAHAISKENVSAKKLIFSRKIKTEAAGAMPGNEKEFGAGPGFRKRTGFLEELGGVDWAKPLGQAERKHGIRLETEKSGVGVVVNGATGPIGEVGGVPDVVPMTVGKQEGVRLDLFFSQEVEKTLWGIDRKAVTSEVDHIGVGGGQSARVGQRFTH